MLAALAVLGYTLFVALLGPGLIARRAWASSWPRLGLAMCQAVAVATVSGLMLMAAMLAVSVQHLRFDLGHLLHACALAVSNAARHPDGVSPIWLGLLSLSLLSHVGRIALRTTTTSRASRRRHRDGLAVISRPSASRGFVLVPSCEPFAYCLPGRGGQIVVSTATTSLLSTEELAAVLAHERAHLRGRHHHLVTFTRILAKALPVSPIRSLADEVDHLVELAADDLACRGSERGDLLSALVRLSMASPPGPALAASGGATVARALRLAAPGSESPRVRGAVTLLVAAVLVVLPWLAGAATAVLTAAGPCPS